MNKQIPLAVSGTFFLVAGLIQLTRVFTKFGIIVSGTYVPIIFSNVAAVILLILSVWMFMASRRHS